MFCDIEVILLSLCFRNVLLQLVEKGGRCGIDYSPADMVYEGLSTVETYPWLGWLFYPVDNYKLTTTVVLITRELVITSAFDVDKYPKIDFRDKSRVVLGSNCSGLQIKIRDYTYHPEYKEPTNSALAIIHLDISQLDTDCDRSTMHIYKMIYVEPEECETFYRKSGLDLDSMWPTYTACAKALSGGKCVWRNGAVLVLREKQTWKLVGLGVYGPGCETPSRYLDYGMYHEWVRTTILRVGKPAVTRIGPDHLILRRTGSVQRFGRCDYGETKVEIYTDRTTLSVRNLLYTKYAKINLTLFANVDYSCVVVRVSELGETIGKPKISLKRWCTSPMQICYELQYMQVDFYVEVEFLGYVQYEVLAYGIEVKLIDRKYFMAYMNNKKGFPSIRW